MQSSYKAGESVTFTWDSTSNTTHYNLWLARSIGNDKWENVEQVFYADNGMTRTFEAGEYRVQLLSYNSDLWETDHSDWVHTWSDDYFFTVEEPVLDSGTCGDNGSNVTWKLTEDGILTISGTGAMIDYGDDKSYRKTPWRDYFIESVRIDEGVTSIGGWAFTNCVLTSVMIPDSVTSIACGAFSECRSLASVTIPDSVTSIGGYAFRGCTGLTSVTIPDSVTSIDGYAFSGCDSLTDVYYAGTAADWAKISISEGNEDLTSAALRCAPASLSAPSVTGGNDSQGRPMLKWNAVSGAAKYEVYRARSMNGDYIKYSTVTGTSYTNISYIENGNTYYYKVRALKSDGTAGAWSSIVSVTYKQTLPAPTVTGGNDSQGRPTLKWNAVTGAAKYEVYRARSLNGDYIKYSTVTGTSYTNTSYIEDGNTYYYKVRALKSDGTAGAWSSVVSVTYRKPAAATVASGKCGDSASWKLDAEGTLTISGTGRMYDYEWPADRGGTTPPWLANKYRDSIRTLRVEQGITYIGRCAFDSCSNLSDVTLPTSLRIIGPWAFNDCTALRSIQLPEGLTTIKEDAFKAAGLVSITFPSTLRELRNCAFMNCEKLQSLRLPEGLTTIGVWAFYCNPNISSIYIPASVTTIGEEAFIYYNNLATVRYGGSQSQWSAVSVAANAFPDGVRYVYNVN